jgi:hypothetical protein
MVTRTLLEQRSDPQYWDVRNHRTGGTESRVSGKRFYAEVILQRVGDWSRNNQNDHEISSDDITK